MRIEFETATATLRELEALAALIDVLRDEWETKPEPIRETGGAHIQYVTTDADMSETKVTGSGGDGGSKPPSERLIAEAVEQRHDPNVLDADGIPWDARIHASTRNQNKDGTWKKLRNVDEVLYGRVHAELQEKYGPKPTGTIQNDGAPQAGGSAPPPPVESPAPSDDNPLVAPPPPPAAGHAVTASVGAAAGNAARFADFASFVQTVNLIRPNGIPYAELNTLAASIGVPGFKDMKDHPHMWETFYAMAGGQ